ncbi:MAG: DNA polymerase III subunit alpha, partial [Desulfovibrio sp.]|nr:DNA polymerase III subunit alpha [Desulfovibrio sp.]
HSSLESCLKDTYGVIVYQEQVMQIAQIIANYTLGGADLLRRAMGKKKAEAMAQQRSIFLSGAEKNSIDEKTANEIFDLMEKFAAYGFNKSHSAAYALVSYYTAYLKVHFKVEFMAAIMSSEMDDQDKLLQYIACCKEMGIDVTPPLVNTSYSFFTAHEGKVVFGLGAIKNVGLSAIESIVEARRQNGPFHSLLDLCERVNLRQVNKRTLEALIKAGACDCFMVSRASMLAALDAVVSRAQKNAKRSDLLQNSLLSFMNVDMESQKQGGIGFSCPEASLSEMDEEQKLRFEKEVLGFFLTSHPLLGWKEELQREHLATIENFVTSSLSEGKVAVLVVGVRETVTKTKGQKMAFVQVEDLTGHADLIVFPKEWERFHTLFAETGQIPLVLNVTLDQSQKTEHIDNGEGDEATNAPTECKFILRDAHSIEDMCARCEEAVQIHVPEYRLTEADLESLKTLFAKYTGTRPVKLSVRLPDYDCLLKVRNISVQPNAQFYNDVHAWQKKEARAE